MIDSKSVKFKPFCAICEERIDGNLYFITAAQHVVAFRKINDNFKFKGFHINFEEFTNQRIAGKYVTGLYVTLYSLL